MSDLPEWLGKKIVQSGLNLSRLSSRFGAYAAWPESLRHAVGSVVQSGFPMFMLWGPDRLLIYNAAYVPILGDKHPAAFARPFFEVWPEVENLVGPVIDAAYQGQESFFEDLEVQLLRDGQLGRAWFTFSYSPVREVDGQVVGASCVCIETTGEVIGREAERLIQMRQREVFEQASGFICTLRGPDHVFEFVNAAHRRLFGSAGWVGKPVRDAFPDIAGQGFYELLDQVYASGEPVTVSSAPLRYRLSPDQPEEERLLDFTYAPLRDASGCITGIFCEGYDVTVQRRGELALMESEAYTRLLLDSTAEAFYAVDTEGVTTLCNAAFVRLLGFASKEEVIGRKLHGVIHHSHVDGSHYPDSECPIYQAASSGRSAVVSNEVFFRLDGTPFPVEYRAEPIIRDGRLEGSLCTFSDVTERRSAQQALGEQARVLATLNETGAALAAELNLERIVQLVTDAGVHLTKAQFGAFFYNVTDAAGKSLTLYTLSGARREDFEKFGHPRATEVFAPTFYGEGVVRSADITADPRYGKNSPHHGMPKNHLPVRSYLAVPVTSRSGEVIGGLFFGHPDPGIFGEETERLMVGVAGQAAVAVDNARLFEAAQRANQTLERRVLERTSALEEAHEALRQAQKMEAVGQLTGGIAHDFNNLLTGVIGSLDMMQRQIAKGETSKIERYATTAMTSANRAAALTHRLLAFSRRQPLDPKPVNSNRLVSGMEELLRRTIGESIALEIVTAGGLWQTLCDPHQLESAILNLAINARDAMPAGGVLTIETCNARLDNAYAAKQRDIAPGQYVCICVTDTGSGMTKDTIEKAFEPFFTTKPTGQGTGLGLSMIYGFTRQSEGYARIYSEVGQGTTVKLYLPRYYGEAEGADEEHGELTDAHRAEAGEVVLVIEDETAVRELVVDVLEELGYRAVEAADGPTGLKLLQSGMRLDLLITDIGLPGLNGRQVVDAARLQRPDLKVLFMTGYAENATIANGFLEPGMEMLTKPFAIEALATRIRDMIER
jgi:PAS domain S-box-containing protein